MAVAVLAWTAPHARGNTAQAVGIGPGWNAVLVGRAASDRAREQFLADAQISRLAVRTPSDSRERAMHEQPLSGPEWGASELWITHEVAENPGAAALALAPGSCVLLHSDATEPVTVLLEGTRTMPRRPLWRGLAGTLVGIGAVLEEETDVSDYFHHDPSLRKAEFYALTPRHGWQPVGHAYQLEADTCLFVRTGSWTDYVAPVEIETANDGRLVFSSDAPEQILRLRNRTREHVEFTVEAEAHEGEPEPPELFAWVPRHAFATESMGGIQENPVWVPIKRGEGLRLEAAGHGSVDVRIAADLTAGGEDPAAPREALLWVRMPGLRVPLPVSVFPSPAPEDMAGLWVGEVRMDQVSVVATGALEPVPRPFAMRIILHVSPEGECRLLSEASVVRNNNPDGPKLVIEPRSRIPVEGQDPATVHQVRTVAYATDAPVSGVTDENGKCLESGSVSRFTIVLDYRHPLNPDVHATHPDHDNLDEGYTRALGEGAEARTVTRRWILTPDAGSDVPGPPFVRGDERIDGRLKEEIEGVYRRTLQTSGRFRLRRISRAPLVIR